MSDEREDAGDAAPGKDAQPADARPADAESAHSQPTDPQSGDTQPRLTDRALDVMSILWREGSGRVGEVRERLTDGLAYTTGLWVLQTLEEKGHVRHAREGRAYRYFPVTRPEEEAGSVLARL